MHPQDGPTRSAGRPSSLLFRFLPLDGPSMKNAVHIELIQKTASPKTIFSPVEVEEFSRDPGWPGARRPMELPRPQRPARAPTPPRTQAAGGKTPAPNYPRKQEQRGALRAHESDKAAKAPKSAASPLGGVAASLSDSRVQQSAAASRSRPATSSSVATHTPTRSTPSQQKRPTTAAAGGGVAGMRRTSAGQLPRVAASSTAKPSMAHVV